MKNFILIPLVAASILTFNNTSFADSHHSELITAQIQAKMTPDQALERLKQGNERYLDGDRHQTDFLKAARLTANGQHPAAIVLSCIDSRVPPEIIFDQGVGNIFVTRVAANVINKDVIAGMEFAVAAAGSKLIVVMGHDSCGAVKGACNSVKLGNLPYLLNKINPAIKTASASMHTHDCKNKQYINEIAKDNVENVVKQIPKMSPVISKLIAEGKVKIIGAMYHIDTGKVTFFK